jgi:hypothetical protein
VELEKNGNLASLSVEFLLSAHLSWPQMARQLENLPHGPGFDPHGYFHRLYSAGVNSWSPWEGVLRPRLILGQLGYFIGNFPIRGQYLKF